MKRQYKTFPLIILATFACVGPGYISSVVSRIACENNSARSIAAGPMEGEKFYINMSEYDSEIIFRRVGSPVEIFLVSSNNPYRRMLVHSKGEVPHVDEGGRSARVGKAQVTLPFVTRVPYNASYGSLAADGGNRYYLCFFGLVFHVYTDIDYVS